jgi:hypothetical protein
MPILVLIILALLVAQVGFWDTFTAVLGAVGVVILLVLLLAALLAFSGYYVFRNIRARF